MRAMKVSLLYATLVLSVLFSAHAKFIVEHGSLKITNPEEVKGDYDIALANFGVPLYGADLRGVFHYPSGYALACSDPMTYPHGFPDDYRFAKVPGYSSLFLLDRGRCRFTEKVINAELAGADAVLICDNVDEQLITMDAGDDMSTLKYVNNISVPAALLTMRDCAKIKEQLYNSRTVIGVIDWSDALPHPDDRVEWEFWSDSNNGCGDKCNAIMSFLKAFHSDVENLEGGGFTKFQPHYLTYHCLDEYLDSRECKEQCLSRGQYCSTDPEDDLDRGYSGRDVVLENLRQLCVFQAANRTGRPLLWWDYVSKLTDQCKMADNKFPTERDAECAEAVIAAIGLSVDTVRTCMGSPDDSHPLLDKEKNAQMGNTDGRGDVTINPTVIINNRHYRGKLDPAAVLKALCAGFMEDREPDICVNPGISENECEQGKRGYEDCAANRDGKTQCVEKFRGYECQCPRGASVVQDASGSEKCEDENECLGIAMELAHCNCEQCVCINSNPGFQCETVEDVCDHFDAPCWVSDQKVDGKKVSACKNRIAKLKEDGINGISPLGMPAYICECPEGFHGDGISKSNGCHNTNECATKCMGEDMECKDTYGSFECTCTDGGLYDSENDVCLGKGGSSGVSAGVVATIIIVLVIIFAVGGYGLYKYRLRSYMDAEIRAIMAQYMPLDKEAEDDIALQDAGPDGMMGGAIGVGEPLGEEPQGNASTGHYTSPDLNEV